MKGASLQQTVMTWFILASSGRSVSDVVVAEIIVARSNSRSVTTDEWIPVDSSSTRINRTAEHHGAAVKVDDATRYQIHAVEDEVLFEIGYHQQQRPLQEREATAHGSQQRRHLSSIGSLLQSHSDLQIMGGLIAEDTMTASFVNNAASASSSTMTAILPFDFAFDFLPSVLRTNLLDTTSAKAPMWHAHRCELVRFHCSLTYMKVPENSNADLASLPSKLTMMNDETVTVSLDRRKIEFNGISVATMQEMENGSVYTVPQLLTLPWYVDTVYNIAAGASTKIQELITTANLHDMLKNEERVFTLLVPSDNALQAIVPWATSQHLKRIIEYHMIADVIISLEDLPLGRNTFQNVLGYPLIVDKIPNTNANSDTGDDNDDGGSHAPYIVTVQGQELSLSSQHLAQNGVVHQIPKILRSDYFPPDVAS